LVFELMTREMVEMIQPGGQKIVPRFQFECFDRMVEVHLVPVPYVKD